MHVQFQQQQKTRQSRTRTLTPTPAAVVTAGGSRMMLSFVEAAWLGRQWLAHWVSLKTWPSACMVTILAIHLGRS